LSAGHLRVVTEGRHHKSIDKVGEVTFNAELARERGQEVLYVTERAVFVLGDDGPVLVEVAPGDRRADQRADGFSAEPRRSCTTDVGLAVRRMPRHGGPRTRPTARPRRRPDR
jgi:hypothetical protein